jgi:hypothetical protein
MTEVEWETCEDAPAMLRFIRGRSGHRKLRLLACACARSRWSWLVEDEYRQAVVVAERCADGLADRQDLRAAYDAIWELLWGNVRGDQNANSAAEATVDDFAGYAADRAVACVPTEAPRLVREIMGNIFRAAASPGSVASSERVTSLAQRVYDEYRFEELPRLAELLSEEGITDETLLTHLHSAGPHFRGCWALDVILDKGQGKDLVTEADWLNETHPFYMMNWWAYFRGKSSARKQRLLACACCRLIWHLMTDACLREAIETAEAYADGLAAEEQLARLHEEALALGLSRGEVLSRLSGNTPEKASLTDSWRVAHAVAEAAGRDDGLFGNAIHYAAQDGGRGKDTEDPAQAALVRDILGSPRRLVIVESACLAWNDGIVKRLAKGAYEARAMPAGHLDSQRLAVLADALEESGCTDTELLAHLRSPGPHVRGCFALDAVLGKH